MFYLCTVEIERLGRTSCAFIVLSLVNWEEETIKNIFCEILVLFVLK